MHPDRQSRNSKPDNDSDDDGKSHNKKYSKKKKASPYMKEEREGAKIRAAREERERMIKEREAAKEARVKSMAQRKKVFSARTKTGQVKLGKQSKVLLADVKKLVGA